MASPRPRPRIDDPTRADPDAPTDPAPADAHADTDADAHADTDADAAPTDLVVQCIEAVEARGLAAVDAFCLDHPRHAACIRRRISWLHALDLLALPPPLSGPPRSDPPSTPEPPRA